MSYVWLDIALGNRVQTSPSESTVLSEPTLLDYCPYLRGENDHHRRADTVIEVAPAGVDEPVVRIRQVLTVDEADPLLDCVRTADTPASGRSYLLAAHYLGEISVLDALDDRYLEYEGPLIEGPTAEHKATITLLSEGAGGAGDLKLELNQNLAGLLPNKIIVRVNRYTVDSIVGARVLRQTADQVALVDQVGEQSIEIWLSTKQAPALESIPAEVLESTPNSTNPIIRAVQSYVLFPLTMLLPLGIVVFLGNRSADPFLPVMWRLLVGLGITLVAIAPLVLGAFAFSQGWIDDVIAQSALQLGLLVLLVVLPLVALRSLSTEDRATRRVRLLAGVATVIAALVLLIALGFRPSTWALPATLLAGVCGAVLFIVVDRRQSSWRDGFSFAMACVTGVSLLRLLAEYSVPSFVNVLVLVLWMVVAYRLTAGAKNRWWPWVAAVAIGLSLMPLGHLLFDWIALLGLSNDYYAAGPNPLYLATSLWLLGNLALAIAAMVLLRRRGADPAVVADPLYRGLACAILLVTLAGYFSEFTWTVASVVVAVGFGWLLHGHLPDNAVRLAKVSKAAHARLVRLEGHRQALLDMAKAHFRASRPPIVSGDRSLRDAARAQSVFDTAAGLSRPPDPAAVRLPRAALGSGAGGTPWRNALASALCAALLSAPMVLYEALPTLTNASSNYGSVVVWVSWLAWWGRWVLVGLLFGYFYPAVRGATPMRKAGLLLVVLLPLELLALDLAEPWSKVVLAAGIRVGHVVVFCLSLGLFWEWRLARAAGFNWGRVRNFAKIRSFVLPATTVLVAAATALATGLAGAAVSGIVRAPAEQPSIGGPPPTSTPERP